MPVVLASSVPVSTGSDARATTSLATIPPSESVQLVPALALRDTPSVVAARSVVPSLGCTAMPRTALGLRPVFDSSQF